MAMSELRLDPATSGELRRLVGEVLAEVLPGLSARGPASAEVPPGPALRPASAEVPPGPALRPASAEVPPGPALRPASAEVPPGPALRPASAEVPPGPALRPAVRPASAIAAGGIPSGVPPGRPATGPAAERSSDGAMGSNAWDVRIDTDAELHEFALRVLRLADNPKMRRDLIAGRIRFRLADESSAVAAATTGAVHRVDKGAVTERAVAAAASAGARLVLGPRAVLTPLARDKARSLGVPIERER